tara:strand:+ start:579 stop:1280 length:702 start_codon:yes stop_codon:yes gene_type:complete
LKTKSICIIPARGSSKGIKYKNLSKIAGKSLLEITIEQALESKVFDRIFVSSESKKILSSIQNIDIPFLRPDHLSEDDVHVSEVVIHALKEFQNLGFNYDNVTMLMPTSPLRTSESINKAMKLFKSSKTDSLVSIENTGKLKTNLRFLNDDKTLRYVSKNIKRNESRQNVDPLYAVNGSIYIAKVSKFLLEQTFHTKNCIGFTMPAIESVDINNKGDLELAKIILNYKNNNEQ